jgi:hypothetical protein
VRIKMILDIENRLLNNKEWYHANGKSYRYGYINS